MSAKLDGYADLPGNIFAENLPLLPDDVAQLKNALMILTVCSINLTKSLCARGGTPEEVAIAIRPIKDFGDVGLADFMRKMEESFERAIDRAKN